MKNSLLLFLFFIFSLQIKAQVAITVTTVPSNTPTGSSIYIAGNFNTWNPGDANYKLTDNGNGTYAVNIPVGTGTLEYKFTRGGWDKVECQSGGADIGNRTFNYSSGNSISVQIDGWKDLISGSGSANVHIVKDSFYMPQLDRYRRVWIYLPPDYDISSKNYPVLYMHDGQNLFDDATSFSGEWHVDESLNTLFSQGDRGCIVIGIENSAERLNEYSPWVNPSYGGGDGDAYVSFIANTLKPYIDNHYRTLTDRLHTGLAGSSMGGLISLYGVMKYQNVFAKAGIFSPSLWFSDELNPFVQATGRKDRMRMYLIAGDAESGSTVTDLNSMYSLLSNLGFGNSELIEQIVQGGQHNESNWSQQFPSVYQWLMMNEDVSDGTPQRNATANNFSVIPNLVKDEITVKFNLVGKQQTSILMYNISGGLIDTLLTKSLPGENQSFIFSMKKYPAGIYLLQLKTGTEQLSQKIEIVK